MPAVLLATRNSKKLAELRRHLRGLRVPFRTLAESPAIPVVREDQPTFEANAIKKAVLPSRRVEDLVVAEDSGLTVDALDGAPGVRTARFAKSPAALRDAANNAKLLRLLRGVPDRQRQAAFICVVAIASRGRLVGITRGVCRGRIAHEQRGSTGFGYDPVFIPLRFRRTFAQLGPRVKDRLSHRSRAMRQARPLIVRALRAARESCRTAP